MSSTEREHTEQEHTEQDNDAGEPPELISRRRLLNRVIFGLSAAAGAVVSIPIIAYLLSPLINPAPELWRDLGLIDDYQVGQTVERAIQAPSPVPWAGTTSQTAVWVRRNATTEFTVFAVDCTHLGCPVRWMPDANLFLCPCHGGVYYSDGTVAAGPPPKPLPRYTNRIQGGHLQILTQPLPMNID